MSPGQKVAARAEAIESALLEIPLNARAVGGFPADNGDRRSRRRETCRDGVAYAPRRAGHERDLARQVIRRRCKRTAQAISPPC